MSQAATQPLKIQDQPFSSETSPELERAIANASHSILNQRHEDGYWQYTLEANESINAEYIFLMHYLGLDDPQTEKGIAKQIEISQQVDGSWPLYYEGPGDLSTTIECYFALKLAGYSVYSHTMLKAKEFILNNGGASQCRIFTRIHLALFGIIDWHACPAMPASMIFLPAWAPVNIYEFSSWARATIVPLLIIMNQKKTKPLSQGFLDEIFCEDSLDQVNWDFKTDKVFLSFERLCIESDRLLKLTKYVTWNPLKKKAMDQCEDWIRQHIDKTEDIYPALAYAAMALYNLDYSLDDPTIQKCLKALKSFQVKVQNHLPSTVYENEGVCETIYQQCCISPVWDTPWAGVALLEAGLPRDHPQLIETGKWLLSKQVLSTYGDWAQKNKKALPGGWSFEFQNDYFPDVDDTIEVLMFVKGLDLPDSTTKKPFQRGLDWLLSMQSANGGWAAFDVDNTLALVNKIPFSDHGACLDPPTADITGRMLELLAKFDYPLNSPVIQRAIKFIEQSQKSHGAWWGRWGVNDLYGTWCVLQGLSKVQYPTNSPLIRKAVQWLESIQQPDGGFGESCASYVADHYIPTNRSVASQTAWALMALISAGEARSTTAQRAAAFLINSQQSNGQWEEPYFSGTGFPGHFYIRYHGYAQYFPLLALSIYQKNL